MFRVYALLKCFIVPAIEVRQINILCTQTGFLLCAHIEHLLHQALITGIISSEVSMKKSGLYGGSCRASKQSKLLNHLKNYPPVVLLYGNGTLLQLKEYQWMFCPRARRISLLSVTLRRHLTSLLRTRRN